MTDLPIRYYVCIVMAISTIAFLAGVLILQGEDGIVYGTACTALGIIIKTVFDKKKKAE